MASESFTLLSFIILCAAHVYSLPTPCRLQGELIQKVNDLLQNMGGLYPLECLDENVNLTFPDSAFKSNRTAQINVGVDQAIYEVLRKIDVVFENDTMPDSWDQGKLDDFRNIVYRLVEESECVLTKAVQEDDFPERETVLGAYFREMTNVLRQKEYSACAWEVVRKETLRTLRFILRNVSDHLFWTKRRHPAPQ
ncbi:hypothetical protein ACEWY4_002312 [Coilia grayii]|uniref:Uncharacterized protein n=1 Tax=Coilia grayii TaxID=363190 RepID=A0ABD1KNI2_9TELE